MLYKNCKFKLVFTSKGIQLPDCWWLQPTSWSKHHYVFEEMCHFSCICLKLVVMWWWCRLKRVAKRSNNSRRTIGVKYVSFFSCVVCIMDLGFFLCVQVAFQRNSHVLTKFVGCMYVHTYIHIYTYRAIDELCTYNHT